MSLKRQSTEQMYSTLVDARDQLLNFALLSENQRSVVGKGQILQTGLAATGLEIDGNSRTVISSVLQPPQPVEQHLQYVFPLFGSIVQHVRENATHLGNLSLACSSSSSLSPSLFLSLSLSLELSSAILV